MPVCWKAEHIMTMAGTRVFLLCSRSLGSCKCVANPRGDPWLFAAQSLAGIMYIRAQTPAQARSE